MAGIHNYKRLCTVKDEINGGFVPPSEASTQGSVDSEGCAAQEEALSNFLILRSIFTHLDASDIKSCIEVSTTWESIASPLLREMEVETRHCNCDVLAEITDKTDKSSHRKIPWADFVSQIENPLLKHKKTYLKLKLGRAKIERGFYEIFLPKCKSLVFRLDLTNSQHLPIKNTSQFLQFLHENFPNLKQLSLNGRYTFTGSEGEIEPGQLIKPVQVIDFGMKSKFSASFTTNILNSVPNLKDLFNFPLEFVDSLIVTKKYGTVRSVVLPAAYKTDPEIMETLVEKFASLQPKLLDFNWEIISCSKLMSLPGMIPSLNKILVSSKDTLTFSVVARPTKDSEYLKFPKMTVLEDLQFEHSPFSRSRSPFFQEGTNLKEIFPKVNSVILSMCLNSEEMVKENFPRQLFRTFESNIKTLCLNTVNPECISELFALFPFVTILRIVWSSQMPTVMSQVYKCWDRLKQLSLIVDHFSAFSKHGKNQNFDAAITGLSLEACNELRSSPKVVEDDTGTLSTLKHLEELNVIITDRDLSVRGKAQNFITCITIDYIRRFLPSAKVFLGIEKECSRVKELMELLKPILPHVECDPCYDIDA